MLIFMRLPVAIAVPSRILSSVALGLVTAGSALADITSDPTAARKPPAPEYNPAANPPETDAVFGMTAEERALIQPFLQQLQGVASDIQETQATAVKKQAMLRKLRAMNVEKVDFVEAPLASVMKSLQSLTVSLDPEKKGVNIIVPPEVLAARKDTMITLKLANVPLSEVLKYSLAMADLGMRVDDYAIMITLPAKAAVPATP